MRMFFAAVTVFATLSSLGRVAGQSVDVNKLDRILESKRLQGGWIAKLLVTNSGIEPYPLLGRGLVFSESIFVRTEGRRTVQAGTARLDLDGSGLDLVVEQLTAWDVEAHPIESKTPFTLRCRYRVVGDLLTVCSTSGKDRPADLKPGEGRTVVVYERVPEVPAAALPKAVAEAPGTHNAKPVAVAATASEYKVISVISRADEKQTEAALNDLTDAGWELVTTVDVSQAGGVVKNRYIFKRPKPAIK